MKAQRNQRSKMSDCGREEIDWHELLGSLFNASLTYRFRPVRLILTLLLLAIAGYLIAICVRPYPQPLRHPPTRPGPPAPPPMRPPPPRQNRSKLQSWPEVPPWSSAIKKHDMDYVQLETSNCTRAGQDPNPLYLILVSSHPSTPERRAIIRDTWASAAALQTYKKMFGADVLVFFVLGSVAGDPELMEAVASEKAKHRDIIQGRFLEAYRNLTHKAVLAIKWAAEYCSEAEYVVRVHDDVFVNGFNLMATLEAFRTRRDSSEKTISCFIYDNLEVQRAPWTKWYTTEDEYAPDIYPKFCGAWGYIMTNAMVRLMYERAPTTPFYWMDDVFLTGLVLFNVTGVVFNDLKPYISLHRPMPGSDDPFRFKRALFVHLVARSVYVQYEWWTEILTERRMLTKEDEKRLKIAS